MASSPRGLLRLDCSGFPDVGVPLVDVRGEYCCSELDKCSRADCRCGWSGDVSTSGVGSLSAGELKLRKSP